MPAAPARRALLGSLPLLPLRGRLTRAEAMDGPARPVRMLVPLPPGSSPDVAARLFAAALSRRRGQPIAVENRPGALGAVAANAFLQARPGEALFFGMGDLLTVTPLIEPGTPFADAEAFVPISAVAADSMAVSVPASLPVRSLPELVDYARARPGALNWYATPGTSVYIAMNAFLRRAGIDAVFVSFRGLMMSEVAQGRVHLVLNPLASTLPFAQDGSVRVLATAGRSRAAVLPDVPTTAEAGYPEFEVEGLHGVFGWRGMPEATRLTLATEARGALLETDLRDRLAASGLRALGTTPEGFAAELAGQRSRWSALAREFGAMPRT